MIVGKDLYPSPTLSTLTSRILYLLLILFIFYLAYICTWKLIDNYEKANKVSMDLFKSSESYQDEYVETNEMTYDDKITDINMMIQHFEEQERYEDCAILYTFLFSSA